MIVAQDYQVKNGGKKTKDSVYQKWMSEQSFFNPPYINNNPEYFGGLSHYKPVMNVFGSGTPKK